MSTVTVPECKFQTVNNSSIPSNNKKRKRKNKNKYKNKQLAAKKRVFKKKSVNNSASKVVFTMSSWAEQFTFAATWQLKHQLAYWKAKAKSLEYENSVLHDIIRKNQHVISGGNSSSIHRMAGSDEVGKEYPDATATNIADMRTPIKEGKLGEWEDTDGSNSQTMLMDIQSNSDEDISDEKQNIEVSEEFIQFLMINAKHKEEMRLERQKQKAAEEQAVMEEREAQFKTRRHYGLSAQELYGEKWQKIAALEMSMKSNFMSDIDSSKASYWPVIPFNFDLHYSYANQKF